MKTYAVALTMMLTGTLTSCKDTAVRENATMWQDYNFTPTQCVEDTSSAELLPPESPPSGALSSFKTDFSRHNVPYTEILSGGPSKDGIPAIDDPKFVPPTEADSWLEANEPVIYVRIGDDARAYPIQILMWHEITNDVVGGIPVVVTFCPLCNTAIAFEGRLDGRLLDFGTTGRLRFSNLIMYDRQTESWWQQALGNSIAGEYTGRCLTPVPASIISWQDFKRTHPNGKVLSKETGYARDYGYNPYAGYDDINETPFLYRGPDINGKLPPMARVLAVELSGDPVAYPYLTLEKERVVNDQVGGEEIVVFWTPGTSSGLDDPYIADGQDVGAATAFLRELDGQTLTFHINGEEIMDHQTGSTWSIAGKAISGELTGNTLQSLPAFNHFWFSWSVFKPETRVYGL